MSYRHIALPMFVLAGLLLSPAARSADADYKAASDRILQTGEQIREAARNARARHDAMVAKLAAEQKQREAQQELERQQALKEKQAKQAQEEERARHEAAVAKARQAGAAQKVAEIKQPAAANNSQDSIADLLAAKRKAAEALKEMRSSGDIRGYE